MKKLLLVFLLLLNINLLASNATLKIDPKGHTGLISDIIVDNDGNIISASVDKTIRVWGSDGVEKRKLLGQMGIGAEGMIFAIALSSDNRYLAVGGFLDKSGNGASGQIRIYNYQNGKLLHILKSHTNVVLDLSFSKDDHYLISGSGDTTAKIWDVQKSFRLKETIAFHTKEVYGVKIIKKLDAYYAITAGVDNQIALYDMQRKRVIKSHRVSYKLQYLASNAKDIAICGEGKEIKIYNRKLELVKTIESKTRPAGLAYSPNGKYLIAGAGAYPYLVNIYSTKNYTLKSTFKKHTNTTMAVNFLNNTIAVSGEGTNNEIYIWDIESTKVKKKIVGVGSGVWSVGIGGESVAWGNNGRDIHSDSSWNIQKSINLKTFQIKPVKNQKWFLHT